jgi:predicted SAM-dependent methyltransferase
MTDTTDAVPASTSECSLVRHHFAPFLAKDTHPLVLEMGAGGDLTVPHALAFDQHNPYTSVGGIKQVFRGHCENLSFLCDNSVDGFATHHLLEDFSYDHLRRIIGEWRRVLRPGGVIAINCPDQQRFLDHCARTGQGINLAHKEPDFSLHNFTTRVIDQTGPWETLLSEDGHGPYSWLLVIKKV